MLHYNNFYNINLHYSAKKVIRRSTAVYKLYELTAPFGRTYIFYVSYNGRSGKCILNCDSREEARHQFCLLVDNYTTPLSLCDTVYELQK